MEKVAKEVTEDFRLLSRTVRAATPETAAERAKLTQVMLGLLSVAATVSHSESPERLYHLLDLIETCNSPELVRQRHDEFKD